MTKEEEENCFQGREVMQELVRRFDIPFTLKDGTTFLQEVTLELDPSDLPKLTCVYVIGRLEK